MKYLIPLCLVLCAGALAESPETILFADFASKPLNEPIGTGGAESGEPTSVSPVIDAVVRAAPGGGRELELRKGPGSSSQSVVFQFLESEEVTAGQIKSRVDLRLGSMDQFARVSLLMREANGASQGFLNLDLFRDGETQIRRSGFAPVRFSDTVLLSTVNVIEILFDIDEKVFSLCLNGQLLTADLEAGLETKRGVGSVRLALPGHNEEAVVWLDEIEVTKGSEGDRVFADRFEEGFALCPF